MRRQKWILVLLAAILAPGAAFAAAPDFSDQMFKLTQIVFGGDNVFDFFDPATADLNENGVLDATEFFLLEEALDNNALSFNAALNSAYTANYNVVDAALTALAASLGQPTSGPNAGTDIAVVLGGYMTMGGDNNWNLVNTILTGSNRATGAPSFNANRGAFNEGQSVNVGPCGDADGDNVKNLNEALAAANEAAYVAAALDNGTTTSGADTVGGCVFSFVGMGGDSQHWFYNPANGNVYFAGTSYQGNLFADQVAAAAAGLSVNGLAIENAHPVIINDSAENTFIAAMRTDDDFHTGANDSAVEGTWKWSDGTTFWIGAATGAAQGGAFVGWGTGGINSGEPNNSSNEDWMEISCPTGGWNDIGGVDDQQSILIEVEGDFTDTNNDGIPNQWTDANSDGIPDGLTSTIVNVSGPSTVTQGQSITLTASSEPGDIYTWTSEDTDIATVEATGTSVDVTGVSPGTVTINVEVTDVAKGLGSVGSFDVTVLEASWFDLCEIEDTFQTQGEFFAGLDVGGLPTDFNDWDVDGGIGDGVPDSWALRLLAYSLCEGGVGLAKTGSPEGAVAAYNSNLAAVGLFATQLNTGVAPFFQGLISQQANIAALATTLSGNPCNGPAGNPAAALGAAAAGIAGFEEDLQTVIDAAPITLAIPELLAGLTTISSEMGAVVAGILPVGDIQGAIAAFAALQGGSGLPTLAAAFGTGGPLAGCPGAAGISASAASISAAIGAVPTLTTPAYAAYQDDAKLASEPLSGPGDYDGDGTTNAQVASIVSGLGGDGDDYVVAASGDFGPFWAGNPALPVGGMVGLGALFSAMGAAGAVVLRRKK